jgi:hypothetical protein
MELSMAGRPLFSFVALHREVNSAWGLLQLETLHHADDGGGVRPVEHSGGVVRK